MSLLRSCPHSHELYIPCSQESSAYDHMQKVESALSDSEHSRQKLSLQLQGAQSWIMALKHDNRKLQDGKRTLLAQSTHVARLSSQLGAMRRESDQLQREKQELRHDLDAMRHQVSSVHCNSTGKVDTLLYVHVWSVVHLSEIIML